jgi:predicted metalloenzyme YecM
MFPFVVVYSYQQSRDLRVFSHKLLFSTLRATLDAYSIHHVCNKKTDEATALTNRNHGKSVKKKLVFAVVHGRATESFTQGGRLTRCQEWRLTLCR